ncbi:NUDIX hydrolase [Nakamurella endophytica]|uniref:Coenzyme A pyrophosphatase n=1 Tax=Nakamurella endophytica TaxID=1748367 RepID=A0A917WGQ7_9ACTN|nr:CoA pyrophosphatase [Nakamurella endophytica]GGM05408.1 coenzyme A pyrophosphatase [Nakamurella endophytica]
MSVGARLVDDTELPGWLRPLVGRIDGAVLTDLIPGGVPPAPSAARRASVLILLGDGPDGPDVLLTGRAGTLRSHAGQPAFPGGGRDPGEDAVATAVREAEEETGLDPSSVRPVATMPDLYLGASSYLVTPVVAHWHTPGPVRAVDPAETAVVARVPLSVLADPAHRGRVRHSSGYVGPAFDVAGLIVWGFTGGLVDAVLRAGGWHRPWDRGRFLELPPLGRALPDPEAGHLAEADGVAGPDRTAAG